MLRPPASAAQSHSRRPRPAPLVALLLALGGCFSVGPLERGEPTVTGSLALAGPTFGERTLAPMTCTSGEHELFLGADLTEAGAGEGVLVARLVVDPLSGPAVRIHAAAARFGPAVVVRREECAAFHFSLVESGWRINDYRVYDVALELDCALPSGDRVAGELAAPGCW